MKSLSKAYSSLSNTIRGNKKGATDISVEPIASAPEPRDKINKLLDSITDIQFTLGNKNLSSLAGTALNHARDIHKRIKRIGDEEHVKRLGKGHDAYLFYDSSYYGSKEFAKHLVKGKIVKKITEHPKLKKFLVSKVDFLSDVPGKSEADPRVNLVPDIEKLLNTILSPNNEDLITRVAGIAAEKLPLIADIEVKEEPITLKLINDILEKIKIDNLKMQIKPYVPLIQRLGENSGNIQNVLNVISTIPKESLNGYLDKIIGLAMRGKDNPPKPDEIIAAVKDASVLIKNPALIDSFAPLITKENVGEVFPLLGADAVKYKSAANIVVNNKDAVLGVAKTVLEPIAKELQAGRLDKMLGLAMRPKGNPPKPEEIIAAVKDARGLINNSALIDSFAPLITKGNMEAIFPLLGADAEKYKEVANIVIDNKDAVLGVAKIVLKPIAKELKEGKLDKIIGLAMRPKDNEPKPEELIAAVKDASGLIKNPALMDSFAPLMTEDNVEAIFPLLGADAEKYKEVAKNLAQNKESCLEAAKSFLTQKDKDNELNEFFGKVTELGLISQDEAKGKHHTEYHTKQEEIMLSAIDLISPDIIAKGIGVLNGGLVTEMFKLPEFKTQGLKAEEEAEKLIAKIALAMKDPEFSNTITSLVQASANKELKDLWKNWTDSNKITDDMIDHKKLKEIAKLIDKEGFSATSKLEKRVAVFARDLSHDEKGIETINKSLAQNNDKIIDAFNAFANAKDNKFSQVVKILGITGEEVVKLIPGIMTPKSLNAISDLIEHPGIVNAAKMVYHTNTLGFGIKKVMACIGKGVVNSVKRPLSWTKKIESNRQGRGQPTFP